MGYSTLWRRHSQCTGMMAKHDSVPAEPPSFPPTSRGSAAACRCLSPITPLRFCSVILSLSSHLTPSGAAALGGGAVGRRHRAGLWRAKPVLYCPPNLGTVRQVNTAQPWRSPQTFPGHTEPAQPLSVSCNHKKKRLNLCSGRAHDISPCNCWASAPAE